MSNIHIVCEVDPSARISPNVVLGEHCVIGPNVTIGPSTTVGKHVTITGHTSIGSGNIIGDGCVFGVEPQDLKYDGSPTLLIIGHHNRFGENVSAHIGTEFGGYLTRIGDYNVFGDYSHIAHDCFVDDHTTIHSRAMLAGHIHICNGVVIHEDSGVHHFVTIGRHAMIGARTPVRRDVPPYTHFCGDRGFETPSVRGVHAEGITAAGLSETEQKELRRALADLFEDETALQTKIEQLVNLGVEGEVEHLCQFCQNSLQGVYGRYRERYRGQLPPEAENYLTREQLAEARRALP